MATQKEVLIKMLVPKTEARINSLTQAQSSDSSSDKSAAAIFHEEETKITVYQVGHMESPKFRQPTLDKPIRNLVFELGPMLNFRSIFYMAAKLTKLEEVYFYFMQSSPNTSNGQMSFQSLIAKKYVSTSVKRIFMFVDLHMFRKLDEENRRNLIRLITSILDVIPKCFPNLSRIGFELPDEGDLQIYKSLYQLIGRVPVLEMAKITTEVDQKRISCYYPFDDSSVQLSLENSKRVYTAKIAKIVVPSSPSLKLPKPIQILIKQEPGTSSSPDIETTSLASALETVTSATTASRVENALIQPVNNSTSITIDEIVTKSVTNKSSDEIEIAVTLQYQNSTSLPSTTARMPSTSTPENQSNSQLESSRPVISLQKASPLTSIEAKLRKLSGFQTMSQQNDLSKQTEPSSTASPTTIVAPISASTKIGLASTPAPMAMSTPVSAPVSTSATSTPASTFVSTSTPASTSVSTSTPASKYVSTSTSTTPTPASTLSKSTSGTQASTSVSTSNSATPTPSSKFVSTSTSATLIAASAPTRTPPAAASTPASKATNVVARKAFERKTTALPKTTNWKSGWKVAEKRETEIPYRGAGNPRSVRPTQTRFNNSRMQSTHQTQDRRSNSLRGLMEIPTHFQRNTPHQRHTRPSERHTNRPGERPNRPRIENPYSGHHRTRDYGFRRPEETEADYRSRYDHEQQSGFTRNLHRQRTEYQQHDYDGFHDYKMNDHTANGGNYEYWE